MSAVPILVLLVVYVAFVLMGRRRRVDTHRAVVAGLSAGDPVITSGGLIGTVAEMTDTEIMVELAPGVVVRVVRAAIIGRPSVVKAADDGRATEDPHTYDSEDAD